MARIPDAGSYSEKGTDLFSAGVASIIEKINLFPFSHESRTFGGKNTSIQIEQDAQDLYRAVCRDTEVLRGYLVRRGYDPEVVDETVQKNN